MHFKGRSALEYLGSLGLNCSGLLGDGGGEVGVWHAGGWALPEVRPKRDATNCSSGT